jgi:hypothetical protein
MSDCGGDVTDDRKRTASDLGWYPRNGRSLNLAEEKHAPEIDPEDVPGFTTPSKASELRDLSDEDLFRLTLVLAAIAADRS